MSEAERRDGAAWIHVPASDLTAATATALADACTAADGDPLVHALVLAGPAGFPRAMRLADEIEHAAATAAVAALAAVRKPLIAMIGGDAHGVGLELALACDLRVAASVATFALPQLAAGAMPFLGGTQRLPRVVGRARSLDLLLTGRAIAAADALAWGLVVRVVERDRLEETVRALVGEIGRGAPLAVTLAKEALHAALDLPLAEGLRLEEDLYALLQTTDDRAEGVRAFLQRRAPTFRGT